MKFGSKIAAATGTLAQTGADVNWVFPALLVGGVIVAGGTWLLVMAYRRRPEETESVE